MMTSPFWPRTRWSHACGPDSHFLLTASDLQKGPHLGVSESWGRLIYKVGAWQSLKTRILLLGLPFLPWWISLGDIISGHQFFNTLKWSDGPEGSLQLYYPVGIRTHTSCSNINVVSWAAFSYFQNRINSFDLLMTKTVKILLLDTHTLDIDFRPNIVQGMTTYRKWCLLREASALRDVRLRGKTEAPQMGVNVSASWRLQKGGDIWVECFVSGEQERRNTGCAKMWGTQDREAWHTFNKHNVIW